MIPADMTLEVSELFTRELTRVTSFFSGKTDFTWKARYKYTQIMYTVLSVIHRVAAKI